MAVTADFISNISEEWIEKLHNEWRENPESVSREWQLFFSGFELASAGVISAPLAQDAAGERKLSGVQSLIYRYRDLGHLLACTDPLSICQLEHPLLSLSAFDLDQTDLDHVFTTRRFLKKSASLREIIFTLRETYCREIGVEFMHIQDPDERQWLIDRMESSLNRSSFSPDERLQLLENLHEAALFEGFLHRRFIGQKRFSLEGGEVLIPVLDALVKACPAAGIKDVIFGMAHRGRLNVLANVLRKPLENIFAEFKGTMAFGFEGEGDVKYHKGYSTDVELASGKVHLTIAANPSHLEAVNPVVEGKCRARQERYGAEGERSVLPLLIHGDAAFAGQGSIMEILNISQLDGYRTGGTVHIVLNNQIGFTTLPRDARSTRYATDVAKMLACPIFHVQGESPEAAVHIIRLALAYRQTFARDVVVELICYRRHGHNEGDEPAFTQPLLYRQIVSRPSVNRIYAHTLSEAGFAPDLLAGVEQRITARLEQAMDVEPTVRQLGFKNIWSGISQDYSDLPVATAVSKERLLSLAGKLVQIPAGFTPHAKILALANKRFEAVQKGEGLDWGNAETLAYATLLEEGFSVRLSGQDCQRGTFNHRHCVLHDVKDDSTFAPLDTVAGGKFKAWNSSLSEFGVLGFDYGFSLETPNCLTIWEAQFGDFANGAQVIIDQFITAGETKWNRASGLVMLLPHGYEGQGPEHSCARIERYLQQCGGENMIMAHPTTPAQMFHLLRRQLKQSFRKPLLIFTPKSLLRHPVCVSTLDDLSDRNFQEMILDAPQPESVKRVLLCSGKIYYDLLAEREKQGVGDTAILRIEQLYPLQSDLLQEMIGTFKSEAEFSWVQEEPANMGAWSYMQPKLAGLGKKVDYIGRPADSSPATGSHHQHEEEQAEIVRQAFL